MSTIHVLQEYFLFWQNSRKSENATNQSPNQVLVVHYYSTLSLVSFRKNEKATKALSDLAQAVE